MEIKGKQRIQYLSRTHVQQNITNNMIISFTQLHGWQDNSSLWHAKSQQMWAKKPRWDFKMHYNVRWPLSANHSTQKHIILLFKKSKQLIEKEPYILKTRLFNESSGHAHWKLSSINSSPQFTNHPISHVPHYLSFLVYAKKTLFF